MRKLATIQEILAINDIPNADAIQVATVKGWKIVIKKEQFKIGDKVIYCEIDSLLPIQPQYEFLRPSSFVELPEMTGFRLRTMQFRKQVSQGLLLDTNILPVATYQVGDDVTDLLGIIKFEKPIPKELEGQIKGYRSSQIKRTDEERVQNLALVWDELAAKGLYYAGEKLDGYSMSVYKMLDTNGICSRDLEFADGVDNVYTRIANKYKIAEKLERLGLNYAVQGELIGLGINKNRYNLQNQDWRIFSIFDIAKYRYLSLDEVRRVTKELGLQTVPIVFEGIAQPESVDKALELADGESLLNPKQMREGLVWRFMGEEDVSFKTISNKFLLKTGE